MRSPEFQLLSEDGAHGLHGVYRLNGTHITAIRRGMAGLLNDDEIGSTSRRRSLSDIGGILMKRVQLLSLFVAALAVVAFVGVPAFADDKAGTHEGTVVKAENGKLTMTGKDDKREHSHDVPATAKITCDGKECKLDELKRGQTVKVTVEKKDNKNVITKIEAKKSYS